MPRPPRTSRLGPPGPRLGRLLSTVTALSLLSLASSCGSDEPTGAEAAMMPLSTERGEVARRSGAATGAARAQAPRVLATPTGFELRHRRHTATLAAGGGVTFLPRQGPAWRWTLTAVHPASAETSLYRPDRSRPALQRGPSAVGFEHGVLIEQYVGRDHVVEQQFLIPEPLSLGGDDLVIAGRVDCNADRFVTEADRWVWHGTNGAVTLGTVTVIDARGQRLPAAMQVEAASTRIVIDGVALAEAAYPVLVDPEIGTNDLRISAMGPDADAAYDAFDPAVAFNATDLLYLVVWEADDNTGSLVDGETEIFGQLLDHTGAPVGPDDFRISFQGTDGDSTIDALDPAVVWNATDNEFLVVWSGDRIAGEDEIYGQRVDGATGALLGSSIRISSVGTDGDTARDATSPSLAYNATDNEYLVVWDGDHPADGESEIHGQRLDHTGAEIGTNDFRISDMGPDSSIAYDAFDPDVVWNATDNEYLVVWEADDDTVALVDNETEIFGQRLSASGAEVGANDFRISDMGPDGDTAYDAGDPAVAWSSGDNRYLVVWEADDNTGSLIDSEFEIFGQLLDHTGAEVGTNDFRISTMGPAGNITYDAFDPDVAYDTVDNEFFVVWEADDDTGSLVDNEFEIFGRGVTTAGALSVALARLSDCGTDGDAARDATNPAVAYAPLLDEVLVAWYGDDPDAGLADGESEILVQLYGDSLPVDSDSDGVRDELDQCPGSNDGDDADGDGVADGCDLCPGHPDSADADGDGTPDGCDLCPGHPDSADADGDGTPDGCDLCSGHPDGADADGDGAPDGCDLCPDADDTVDGDADGTPDCLDDCPTDADKTAAGACGCGEADTDTDADGTADCLDDCPTDVDKTAPGACGCGEAETDADADGTADCLDDCPADAAKTAPGACGCGEADTDTDADGTADCLDDCPTDAAKTAPGACGCGEAEDDADSDGVCDAADLCPDEAGTAADRGCPGDTDAGEPSSGCSCKAAGSSSPSPLLVLLAGILTVSIRRPRRRE